MIVFEPSATDTGLAFLPLAEVKERLRAELIAAGKGRLCGECGKPFTAARKVHGVLRLVTVSDAGVGLQFYLVCRRCAHVARDREVRGGSVASDPWRTDARRGHEALCLLVAPAKGTA